MAENVLAEALRGALEMEEKGQAFYRKAAEESRNDVAKKTFKFLADDELLHIETIKNFYKTMKEKGDFPLVELSGIKSKRFKNFGIFLKSMSSLKEKIKSDDDEKKALKFAMEFENDGYKYYEDMLKKTKDEKLIKFLKFLLDEESHHYDLLKNTYSYINDTHNWFMYEEGSFPQGG